MRFWVSAILAVLVFGITGDIGADSHDAPRELTNDESNFYESRVQMELAPQSPFSAEIRDGLQALNPRIGIEISLAIPVTEEAFTETGRLQIYNILRSVSTMEGLEYYSASDEEMQVFYHESYAVDGPEGETPIPDPVVDTIPRDSELWAFQRDGSFGRNVQHLRYTARDDSFLVSIQNETTMVYTIVPLVRPGNLRTFLVVRPAPDRGELTFYGNLAVRVPAMFGMQDRARDSFYNRIVALHDWFTDELRAHELLR
ncbi:MAG: DUF6675 family protein [Alkalispirochaeta sp.]